MLATILCSGDGMGGEGRICGGGRWERGDGLSFEETAKGGFSTHGENGG
jgi:hypothetical protein